MATNLTALQQCIKCLADAAEDTIHAVEPNQTTLARMIDFENLVPDLAELMPEIGDVPSELSALSLPDVVTLTQALVTDLGITDAHAQGILKASLKVLNDILIVLVPDIEALVAAIKTTLPPIAAE